ncbi:Chitotriosidase-1 [Halotydeus destructor]|nr:Chitotriosidase-1 [Halotydeus destructor]
MKYVNFVLVVILVKGSNALNNLNCYIHDSATRDVNVDTSLLKGCTFVIYEEVPLANHVLNIDEVLAYNLRTLTSLRDGFRNMFYTLIAVPGFGDDKAREMSMIASSKEGRSTFIKSIMFNLDKHKLDGVVIDWRYPGQEKLGNSNDRHFFSVLLKELRETLDKVGYFLGIHAAAQSWYTINAYEPLNVSNIVDFIDLHAFSFSGSWESTAGHNTPLRRLNYTVGRAESTVDGGVQFWLQDGVNRSKVNLGVASFGWFQWLVDANDTKPFAKTNGGEFAYSPLADSCTLNYDITTPLGWDAPVGVLESKWLSFENQASMLLKIEYAREKQLGGIAFYSVDSDDRSGLCQLGKSPLLRTVVDAVAKSSMPKLIKTGLTYNDIYETDDEPHERRDEAKSSTSNFVIYILGGAVFVSLVAVAAVIVFLTRYVKKNQGQTIQHTNEYGEIVYSVSGFGNEAPTAPEGDYSFIDTKSLYDDVNNPRYSRQ